MEHWNKDRYEQEKRDFIRRRVNWSPLWGQFTLLFAVTWGTAWACSALLLHLFGPSHPWARLLPLRYAIVFIFAYACFFLAVRVWVTVASKLPERSLTRGNGGTSYGDFDFGADEGCLYVLLVFAIGAILSGLFLAIGGAPLLLEVAFEAVFAGVVVARPLRGNLVLGDWKGRLLTNTWKPALGAFIALVSLAAYLHTKAPQATTFAQAVGVFLHDEQPARPHQPRAS